MRQYFIFEWKAFIRNKKNIAVVVILLLATLYYALFLIPDYQPNEEINERDIRTEHDSMVHWIDNMQGDGMSSGASFALAYFPERIELDAARLEALENNDYESYAEWTSRWYIYEDSWIYGSPDSLSYNHVYYGVDQDYPRQEGRYWYLETANRYEKYVEEKIEIVPDVLEERTALQTGYRLLNNSWVPLVLIAIVVFYSNDVIIKDRHHLTIVKSFPLSLSGKLWTKTFIVMTAALGTILVLGLLSLIIVGFQHGVGSFSIPVSVYDGYVLEGGGSFETISIGVFYVQAFVLISLIFYLFTRGIVVLSLVVRNEFFNLLIGLALIFSERLYYMRGIGFFSNVDLLPPTFFPVGQVLSGYQNHLYNSPAITFQNGVYSLLGSIIVVEIVLFIATRFKKIQTFI